jgi:alpha-beta hydrolase superfamily lysophospholipase
MCLFYVAACTPVVQNAGQEIVTPRLKTDYFQAADGARLPLKVWSSDNPEAVLIAVHGMNDYRNAFALPGSWWLNEGITTIAYDQRGFGETENAGIWPGQDLMIDDLSSLIRQVKNTYPKLPVYLLGESMGAAVVMTASITDNFPEIDGVILSAPAIWGWQSMNIFYQSILWTAAHTIPDVKLSGRGLGVQASDNISMLINLGQDPLFIKNTRIDAIYGLVDIMDEAYLSVDRLKPPALLLYGAKDELVPRAPVEEMASRIPDEVDVVIYEDGWHMLMRDLQAPVVWRDIAAWIKTRSVPSGKQISFLPLFPASTK